MIFLLTFMRILVVTKRGNGQKTENLRKSLQKIIKLLKKNVLKDET